MDLPPRIPRAEAVGPEAIAARMYDLEQEAERVDEEIEANLREFDERVGRKHEIASEYERLRRKLLLLPPENV